MAFKIDLPNQAGSPSQGGMCVLVRLAGYRQIAVAVIVKLVSCCPSLKITHAR
jgi:hypothetical protein